MPPSKIRIRTCQHCGVKYELGVDSTQHKYCSTKCRSAWHYNRWKSSGGNRCKIKAREYWLRTKYDISIDDFRSLLEEQGMCCAVCKRTDPNGYNWHVDHCHKTKKVRGILCASCNQALGHLQENPETIKRLMEYVIEKC